jgi:uncharacterized protein (TIGR02246 family)
LEEFMRSPRTLSALVVVAMVAACAREADTGRTEAESPGALATPAADPAAVRRVIDSSNAVLVAALTKEDAAAHSALYAPDGVVMMSNMPAWKGQSEIQSNAAKMFADYDLKEVKFTTDNVEVSGDLAVETGTYVMTVVPKGGPPMPDEGKYITVWKRQADGTWKVFRDISNSSKEMK